MSVMDGKKRSNGFVHDALFYNGTSGFLHGVSGTVRAGQHSGEPVLVAVPGEKIGPLQTLLGSDAASVRFVDMTEAGRNPSGIIANVLTDFADTNAGLRVLMVGEPIWPGRSSTEYATAVQHEALINIAFGRRNATIVCPYDAAGLDAAALHDARRTHPAIVSDGERRDSPLYGDPVDVAAASLEPLPEPTTTLQTIVFAFDRDLANVRNMATQQAHLAGMDADRIRDLRLAVNEVATNTLAHTGEPGLLRIWRDGAFLVCEIRDTGRIHDPLVGRRRVRADTGRGQGLLLVNRVCDLVQITSDLAATTVRLSMRCSRAV